MNEFLYGIFAKGSLHSGCERKHVPKKGGAGRCNEVRRTDVYDCRDEEI